MVGGLDALVASHDSWSQLVGGSDLLVASHQNTGQRMVGRSEAIPSIPGP